MSQQKEFRLIDDSYKRNSKTILLYSKNNIPMLPATSVEFILDFTPQLKINNKRIQQDGKIYTLMEEPEVIDSMIYIPADFFLKSMLTSLCFNYVNSTIEANVVSLEDECTLFIKKGEGFSITLTTENEENFAWQHTVSSKNAITLVETLPVAISAKPIMNVWGTRLNAETGKEEYFEESVYDTRIRECYMFSANKIGDFMLIFRNTKGEEKKFRIVAVG